MYMYTSDEMYYYKVLTCLLCFNLSLCKLIEIKCPSICKCDIIKNLKRATCYNHNIVTLEADIPKEVEIIDLAFNQISHLDDHIFLELEYTKLRLLNLSHNKVSNIHINAFAKLELLKTIDLSHNAIQYILPNWFWDTINLEELYLSNNYLDLLKDDQLESNSLKTLDISNCYIRHITENAFINVPNLKNLDLSDNSLIKIGVNIIRPLKKLTILNIENNQLSCNDDVKDVINYCKKRKIKTADMCEDPFEDNQKKFEKIIIAPKVVEKEETSWIYDEDENRYPCISENSNTNSSINNDDVIKESRLPLILLCFSIIFGYVMGLITANCKIICNWFIKRKRNNNRRKRAIYEEGGLIEYMTEMPESTPIPQRRILY